MSGFTPGSGSRPTISVTMVRTAGMADVGGRADEADGFSVVPGEEVSLVGCMSFDRTPGGLPAQQRYGFDVPSSLVEAGMLVAPIGWGSTGGLINQR